MLAALRTRMLRIAQIAIVLLTCRVAFAQASEPEPEPEVYGLHILAADLVPVGILSTATVFPQGPYLEASVGAYLLGGPIVHTLHGEYKRAAASLGLRVGLPIAGLLVGDLVHQATNPGDPHPWNFDGPPSLWWVLGGVAGFVAAMTLDQRVLAGGYHARRASTVTPTANASRDGLAFGVVAAF